MGWFRDFLNRFLKKKSILRLNSGETSYNDLKDELDMYKIDLSKLGNKSNKETQIECAIEELKSGVLIDKILNKYNELTRSDLQACSNIAIDMAYGNIDKQRIENIGGVLKVIDRMVAIAKENAGANKAPSQDVYKYIPIATRIVDEMLNEKNEAESNSSIYLEVAQEKVLER